MDRRKEGWLEDEGELLPRQRDPVGCYMVEAAPLRLED